MGTSGAYGGSGGAWGGGGQQAEDFATAPNEEEAKELVDRALRALRSEEESEQDQDQGGEAAADFMPAGSTLPGLRVRQRSGAGGDPGGGSGGGSGRTRTSGGGGGRSRTGAARAGGRAIAAGYALRTGDAGLLATFGLALADLVGLDVFDQVARILDATTPASGSPQESEVRRAESEALILLLNEGGSTPRDAVEAFVCVLVFEAVITEYGERMRAGDPSGNNLKEAERQIKAAIRAYAQQVELPDDTVSAASMQQAIETVLKQTEELVS